jgi:Domain of unknown function (DUF1707)
MIWPGDERAAPAERGYMRTSHADREQMIDALKLAFVEGRLTKDEFDARIGQALSSRTYAELATVTADIPARLPAAPPRMPPRRRASSAARWGTSGFLTPAILAAAFAIASTPGGGGYGAVAFVIAFGYFLFWLSVGANMLWEWHRTSLPGVHLCVRCGHTAASHRAPASCTAPAGSAKLWRRCVCMGYVPPGKSPKAVRHALPTHG